MATDPKNRRPSQQNRTTRTHIGSKEISQSSSDSMLGFIPEKFRDVTAVAMIFLALILFFAFGKVLDSTHTFNAGDNVASESFKPFVEAAKEQGQNVPQWIPNIFSGMPAFAGLVVTGERTYDLVHEIFDVIQSIPVAIIPNHSDMVNIWHYFVLGLGMFLLLRVTRKSSRMAALFAAIAAMFSTWIITYVMIGHNTKIFAVMTMPYIFMGIEMLREKGLSWQKIVLWSAVLAISFHFLLESTHMQMAFYIFLAILLYYIYSVIAGIVKKENVGPLIRSGVLALVMVGLAFAMSADRYLATLGYEPYSIRGAAPIVEKQDAKASSTSGVDKSGGLDWDYATAWSFSPQEVVTFFVPAWYGFGKLPAGNNITNVDPDTRIHTYWGQMNGTDAANYTGTIVLFLAVIAIATLWKKDRLVGPLAIISLFAILLSFGGNLPVLFGPMFNYFPVFNKFRAPMMALVLMQLSFPILAALCLDHVLKVWKSGTREETEKLQKTFKLGIYAAGALLAVFYIMSGFGSSLRSSINASGKYQAYPEQLRGAITDIAVGAATSDILICMLIAAAGCALIYFFLKKKLSPAALGIGILLLTVIDLWRVDYRPMEVTTRDEYASHFTSHDYVDFIKQDKSLYRVLDMNNPVSNVPASWGMQTIAGYHAAKMRPYQDVVDVTGKQGQGNVIFNPFMWDLLNTKYIIADGALTEDQTRFTPVFQSRENSGQKQSTIVWQNPSVLPRAFLVNRYEVKPKLDILNAMRDGTFNPRDVVFFDEQPKDIGTLAQQPVDTAQESAAITSYKNEEIEIKTKTAGDRLVFMSDTWYPDWSATIDGKEAPIYKANYTFRAIKVPAGEHTIKITYYDPKYAQGKTLSLITNILALGGLALGAVVAISARKKKVNKGNADVVPSEKELENVEA